MTLRDHQSLFVKLLPRLIDFAYAEGYELTLGEAWRTPEQAALNAKNGKGIMASLHIDRLAVDLNLFIDGVYVTGTAAHKPLGEFWESLHPSCAWGGRFNDGNHYSLSWQGRK